VTITTATSGSSIRYTTDGTTPSDTNGNIVSGSVDITSTTTLKAIAFKSGMTNSNVTTAVYTIQLPVEAPEGTAARPIMPDSSSTSVSMVGLPRESRISRATKRRPSTKIFA
jgi:hypothetical protein